MHGVGNKMSAMWRAAGKGNLPAPPRHSRRPSQQATRTCAHAAKPRGRATRARARARPDTSQRPPEGAGDQAGLRGMSHCTGYGGGPAPASEKSTAGGASVALRQGNQLRRFAHVDAPQPDERARPSHRVRARDPLARARAMSLTPGATARRRRSRQWPPTYIHDDGVYAPPLLVEEARPTPCSAAFTAPPAATGEAVGRGR